MSMINWYWKQEVNTNDYQGNDPHNINHSCHKPQNTVDTNGYQGNNPHINHSCHKT